MSTPQSNPDPTTPSTTVVDSEAGQPVQPRKRPVASAVLGLFAVYMFFAGLLSLPLGLVAVLVSLVVGYQAYRIYHGARDTVRKALMVFWGAIGVAGVILGFAHLNFAYIIVGILACGYTVYLYRGGRWMLFIF